MKKLLFTLLFLATQIFAAQRFSAGLNVNANAVEFEGKVSMAPLMSDPIYRNFYLNFNLINDDDTLLGAGFYVENSVYSYQPLIFEVGIRTLFTSNEGEDFFAIPVMFGFKHKVYWDALPIGTLGAKMAFAPSSLTFQDADRYMELRIEAAIQIIENVEIYVGYRNIETDYEEREVNYNDSGYIGFRFVF